VFILGAAKTDLGLMGTGDDVVSANFTGFVGVTLGFVGSLNTITVLLFVAVVGILVELAAVVNILWLDPSVGSVFTNTTLGVFLPLGEDVNNVGSPG